MTVSYQDLIQMGARVVAFPAGGAVTRGAFVQHDGAAATVTVVTSGVPYGITANDAATGEDVFVVIDGPAVLKFAGSVTANAQIVPTTAGSGIAATSATISRCVCTPDPRAGAGYVSGDLGFVLLGSRYLIP